MPPAATRSCAWNSGKDLVPSLAGFRSLTIFCCAERCKDAQVVVASYEQLQHYERAELDGKTVITATISEERLEGLAEKGVRLVLDCSVQPFRERRTSTW
jgi:transaldolase